jgi:hypothetical protein
MIVLRASGLHHAQVYNDSKFVLPLIVRRGVARERSLALTKAASCCMTAGTATYTTTGELAITDSQADDPCPGAGYIDVRELSRQRRNLFGLQDVVAYAEVIRKCIEVLETIGDADVTVLQAWLVAQQSRFTLDKVFLSAWRDGDVLWVDWMLIFRNGAVGMAQVAKGEVKPVYSTKRLGKGVSPLTRANIDKKPAETNVDGLDIAFPPSACYSRTVYDGTRRLDRHASSRSYHGLSAALFAARGSHLVSVGPRHCAYPECRQHAVY